jgi:ABC-type transport system involved in cytochrome c biogenesis ATPase subunit
MAHAPPQLAIPYVVPSPLWTLDELKAALVKEFPDLATEEGQGC